MKQGYLKLVQVSQSELWLWVPFYHSLSSRKMEISNLWCDIECSISLYNASQDLQPACSLWRDQFLFRVKGKFQAFYQYAKTFNSDDFDYEDLKNSDYIFMRWKVRCCLRQAWPYVVVSHLWSTAAAVCHSIRPLRSSFWSQTTQSKTSVELPLLDSTTSASRNPQQRLRATTTTGALNGNI